MRKRRQYRELADIELGSALDQKICGMTEAAERDIDETRVNFRWGRKQVATVKLAAEILGVPYQTYIKEAIFRQAVSDIGNAQRVFGEVVDEESAAGAVESSGEGKKLDRAHSRHGFPILGGPDENKIVRQRLQSQQRRIDGPSFLEDLLRETGDRP